MASPRHKRQVASEMLTERVAHGSAHPNECVAAVVVKLPVKLSTPEALARNAQEATETKSRLFYSERSA